MPVETIWPQSPVTEILHGVTVVDRYRWLENRSSPDTDRWIRGQHKRCDEYFAARSDSDTIRDRVHAYLDLDVIDQPVRIEGRYFYRRRDRGREQGSIYTRDVVSGEERLLVDPSKEGAFASVSISRISDDACIVAYEVRDGGEDKCAVRFVDVKHGEALEDTLEIGYARGLVLRPEEGGFYYCHEAAQSTEEHTVSFRRFGETSGPRVVFRAPRTRESRLIVTSDSTYIGVIWLHDTGSGSVSDFFIAALGKELRWTRVFADKESSFRPFLHNGRIYARYVDEAEILCVSEFSSDGRKVRTVIRDGRIPTPQIAVAGDKIYANHVGHLSTQVSCWSLNGDSLPSVDAPEHGSITLEPHRSANERSLFYTYESFHQPPTIFEYDCSQGKSQLFHQRLVRGRAWSFRATGLAFPAKDGVEVPLTLVSNSETMPDQEVPVMLTTYGGFGTPITPQFSVLTTVMMELGAVLALAHVRGGGEFGERWHKAGSKRNRQTGIDDLLAAAEWLRSRRIATPKRLGAFGGSNAGLMLAAAMTQRPDLFGAVLCIAPLLDMVRYEYFDRAARWRYEYGTVEDPEDFCALLSYSPYHRVVENVDYPPIMFVSGDRDDRCNPAHVRKMAARMQDRPSQQSTVIVDYSNERGHMPTLPLSIRVGALTRRIVFLCRELNIALPTGEDK